MDAKSNYPTVILSNDCTVSNEHCTPNATQVLPSYRPFIEFIEGILSIYSNFHHYIDVFSEKPALRALLAIMILKF